MTSLKELVITCYFSGNLFRTNVFRPRFVPPGAADSSHPPPFLYLIFSSNTNMLPECGVVLGDLGSMLLVAQLVSPSSAGWLWSPTSGITAFGCGPTSNPSLRHS